MALWTGLCPDVRRALEPGAHHLAGSRTPAGRLGGCGDGAGETNPRNPRHFGTIEGGLFIGSLPWAHRRDNGNLKAGETVHQAGELCQCNSVPETPRVFRIRYEPPKTVC